jgi:hypothetical protein
MEMKKKQEDGMRMTGSKKLSGAGWLVVGVVLTLILVPAGVAVATVTYSGIEGSSQQANVAKAGQINQAGVSDAGQLLTTEATPEDTFSISFNVTCDCTDANLNFSSLAASNEPYPSNAYPVVTELQVDTYSDPSPGGSAYLGIYADPPDDYGNDSWYTELADVNPPGVGVTTIPIDPGEPLEDPTSVSPSGATQNQLETVSDGINALLTVSGYWAPCTKGALYYGYCQ